ncbi:MAG: non-heme iron oxygenase ferredoxin subunit [Thaumarchaeota archaeon]|nr:non-heme iron oxygenase ferredoxin subunit [Nitrososphaerota archaeon]
MKLTAKFVRALSLSELQPGAIAGVELEGTQVLLSNLDGEVHAVSGICTHEDYDLSQGFVLEGAIVCTLHLSQFDLKTGQVYNPPATEPLRVFNVKIEGDIVFVEV